MCWSPLLVWCCTHGEPCPCQGGSPGDSHCPTCFPPWKGNMKQPVTLHLSAGKLKGAGKALGVHPGGHMPLWAAGEKEDIIGDGNALQGPLPPCPKGAGVHTDLCFADMPSSPRLLPGHGLSLLILACASGSRCQFTPSRSIRLDLVTETWPGGSSLTAKAPSEGSAQRLSHLHHQRSVGTGFIVCK